MISGGEVTSQQEVCEGLQLLLWNLLANRIGVSYRVESRDTGQDQVQLNSDGWTGRQADSLSKSSQQ